MADLIDRREVEAFIGALEMVDVISGEAYKTIICHLGNMPSAQPEQRWIPCSERLPDKKQDVIVSVNNGAIYTDTDEWTGTGFWAHGYDVIAWMPLPEPWRGEGDE